jgi:hypothetical protein
MKDIKNDLYNDFSDNKFDSYKLILYNSSLQAGVSIKIDIDILYFHYSKS